MHSDTNALPHGHAFANSDRLAVSHRCAGVDSHGHHNDDADTHCYPDPIDDRHAYAVCNANGTVDSHTHANSRSNSRPNSHRVACAHIRISQSHGNAIAKAADIHSHPKPHADPVQRDGSRNEGITGPADYWQRRDRGSSLRHSDVVVLAGWGFGGNRLASGDPRVSVQTD